MTSPLPWKQLALILLLGGGVICPSLWFILHRIRKLCQDLSFCNIWKYMRGCTILPKESGVSQSGPTSALSSRVEDCQIFRYTMAGT